MIDLAPFRSVLEPHDLTFMADSPYVYHCHHYNLFHDQTVDDILGEEAGRILRMRAARSAFHDMLSSIVNAAGLTTPVERIQFAQSLIAHMGHGRVSIQSDSDGGSASVDMPHYGYSWNEKYGARVKRLHPADAVIGGFCAASIEVAYGLPKASLEAQETSCIARRDSQCHFHIIRSQSSREHESVRIENFADALGKNSESGRNEEQISAVASVLQTFMTGVGGDERGLIEAFGVFVSMHLGNYYNETAFESIRLTEERNPELLHVAEGLFNEAGHVCVFNTFSNILLSPEWESVAGPLESDPQAIVVNCLSIARGLGFGRWTLQDYAPGKQLVVSSTSNYEAPFWLTRYGRSQRPRSYVFQGAALAIMVIATRMKLWERPDLNQEAYDRIFKGSGIGFTAKLVECQTRGDARTTVVVSQG